MASKSQEKAWRYVGRFMESFANVEASIDVIFETIFNLNAASMLLLQGSLDFGKRVELIRLGLAHQRVELEHVELLERAKGYSKIRNAVAHSQFEPVLEEVTNGVRYEAGIEFSGARHNDKIEVPSSAKVRERKRKESKARTELRKRQLATADDDDSPLDKSTITYSEFDEYDADLRNLMESLVEIGERCAPIDGVNLQDVAMIVATADNVYSFRKSAPKTK